MIWLSRKFSYAEYVPYMKTVEQLLEANSLQYRQFMMVSTATDEVGESSYFVGLPSKSYLRLFDGFAEVSESELPREINTLLVADATTDEFKSRFEIKRLSR